MRATHLRTEYLHEPLGLDIRTPRFSWNVEGGLVQTAYRVVARRRGEVVWDTGVVSSHRMTHVSYAGEALRSRDRVVWSVTVWDEEGIEGATVDSWFELGLLDPSEWTAKWIGGDYTPKKNTRYPVDCFRRIFSARGPVSQARLYMTAAGIYDVSLNGKNAGEFRLAPGATDYRHRLQYQSHDITDLLEDENRLEVQLADGWYRGSIGAFGLTHVFGRETKFLLQLEILYADGSTEVISSDERFEWSNDGPVRFADLKDGEVYDARMTPSYDGAARVRQAELVPSASNNVAPKEHERFRGRLITTPSGARVLDFGQNIAGFLAFTVTGAAGQQIAVRLGETLDENGEFTQRNFQIQKPVKEFGKLTEALLVSGQTKLIRGEMTATPRQQIDFICSGGVDEYVTRFAVFGFRYALVESDPDVDLSAFEAIAVYSDLEQTGTFTCSHEGVNKLLENTRWSMKGNFLDVPTDCPTRERLGWTGDAQVFFDTAAYLMDVAAFFRKWLRDLEDGQLKSGKPSAVAPYNGAAMVYDNTGGSVGWGDAIVLLPYRFWKRYGDADIIADFYPAMRRYAMFMITNAGVKDRKAGRSNPHARYVYEKGFHLGEWLEAAEFKDDVRKTPRTEEATAYLHYTMSHLAEIATELGRAEDAALFDEYAAGAKRAYRHLFAENGIDTDRQAKLVRPLALGLLDGAARTQAEERLVQAVQNRGYRVNTGFLSTPFILPVLSAAGRSDVAYRMLENEEAPSWLAEVTAGATTVWEDWEGTESHNHYSPGAVCQWLFDTVAGIRVTGENEFAIAPIPGGSLTFAEAEYASLYGTVRSTWSVVESVGTLTVDIPANTVATVTPPEGSAQRFGAGRHTFDFLLPPVTGS